LGRRVTNPTPAAVDAYLKQLQKSFAQGDATEHTHRPALQLLLEASAANIKATNEPKSAERENKPDYIVRKRSSIVGFVEAKDIGADLKKALKTPQLKRYLEALPNLLLTNYTDFIWCVGGEKRMEVSLATVNGKAITPAPDAAQKWMELITSFLAIVTPTLTTPSQVAKSLAGQTRLLRDLAKELLEAKDADLLSQEASFRALLVPDLKSEEFADMYAQTAAYGLFTARVFEHTPMFGGAAVSLPDSMKDEDFNLEKAAYLIPKANPFLRQFFQHVASPNLNAQLRWLIEQIADSLRFVDMDKVLHRQGKRQGFEDPVFHFYERFLFEYDPALRKSRGVYYTPEPVVDYIVRGVDELLQTRFNKPRGLADPSALILDPATGTATFLRKVIDVIHKREVNDGAGGSWPDYVRSKLLPRVFGFELMMAPYTVAHLKLALQLQEQGFQFANDERLQVFLTNTLDQLHQQTSALLGQWIAAENEGAERVKRDEAVVAILGNPPYAGESRNKSVWITDLMAPYKLEPDKSKLKEQNSKWINNDYVKFIRFSHDRIVRTGHGIVAFVTSNSFLDGPIFRGMRARLMEDFDEIFIIDLHGNGNKEEKTPQDLIAHGVDKNVFDILEGVSLTFLVKHRPVDEPFELALTPSNNAHTPSNLRRAIVRHLDVWGSREFKYNWLQNRSISDSQWSVIEPELPQLPFAVSSSLPTMDYTSYWSVSDIFPVTRLGPNSHRDHFATSISQSEANQRIAAFFDKQISDETIRSKYSLTDNRDWQLHVARTKQPENLVSTRSVWRAFDFRWMLYGDFAYDYPRNEVNDPIVRSSLALVSTRQTKADFAALVVDLPLAQHKIVTAYDGSYVSPLFTCTADVVTQLVPNLAPRFLLALGKTLDIEGESHHHLPTGVSPDDILAYIYAVLHAPSYRSRYAEFLKSDFPRIPIALDVTAPAGSTFADVWTKLLPLGQEMIDLHLLRKVPSALRASFNVSGNSEVEKPRYEPPNTPMNPRKLGRVYINATQCFEGVTPET
jgi:hypothetical protein